MVHDRKKSKFQNKNYTLAERKVPKNKIFYNYVKFLLYFFDNQVISINFVVYLKNNQVVLNTWLNVFNF